MSEPAETIDVNSHEHDAPEPTVAALTPAIRPSTALVEPAATSEATLTAFRAYNQLCEDLLTKEDYQQIGRKEFRKKSGWRKLAVAFGVSCELLTRDHERDDGGRIVRTEIVVRATAPNGRYMDGIGACDLYERCCERGCTKNHGQYGSHCPAKDGQQCDRSHFSKPQHDIPATAMTRATNRACADLFGMGEVSAEEVHDGTPTGDGSPGGHPVGHDAAGAPDDGDAFCTPEQFAKVRELTGRLPADLKRSVVHSAGKQTLIFGLEVRTADGKSALLQSQYGPLIERLTNVALPEDEKKDADDAAADAPASAKADPDDPEQAPFDKPDESQLTGAGAQPEPSSGKTGYDNWPKKDLAAECEVHGLPKSGETSKLIGRLRAWDATNRDDGYVEPDERPF